MVFMSRPMHAHLHMFLTVIIHKMGCIFGMSENALSMMLRVGSVLHNR